MIETSETTGEIAKALAKVTREVSRVAKNGRVKFGRTDYAYVTEADLLDAVREPLGAAGLAVATSSQVEPGDGNVVRVRLTVRLMHESGEWIQTEHVGASANDGDKAVYAAITGATKYALLKTFLVSTGDDPERAHNQGGGQGRRHGGGQGARQRQGRRTDQKEREQRGTYMRRLKGYLDDQNLDDEDVARERAVEFVAAALFEAGAAEDAAFAKAELMRRIGNHGGAKDLVRAWVAIESERAAQRAA